MCKCRTGKQQLYKMRRAVGVVCADAELELRMMNNREYRTKELMKRFIPYFMPYRKTLFMDLFCAALTTICELVLPLIMRYITNEGLYHLAELSVKTIGGLGLLYLLLRVVDAVASYYMADMGHVMGASGCLFSFTAVVQYLL